MNNSEHADFVTSTQNALSERMGMEVLQADENQTIIRMPVAGNTQISGHLHGGATAALCETAASTAAFIHAQKQSNKPGNNDATSSDPLRTVTKTAVGTEITVSHLRPVQTGFVTATATAVHLGRTRTVHTITVKDDEARAIATGLATNMIIEL